MNSMGGTHEREAGFPFQFKGDEPGAETEFGAHLSGAPIELGFHFSQQDDLSPGNNIKRGSWYKAFGRLYLSGTIAIDTGLYTAAVMGDAALEMQPGMMPAANTYFIASCHDLTNDVWLSCRMRADPGTSKLFFDKIPNMTAFGGAQGKVDILDLDNISWRLA